jgi:hypothetical protein
VHVLMSGHDEHKAVAHGQDASEFRR